MATTFEGQGTTFTKSGITLAPKKITIPGWEKEEIDVTTLNNTDVKTYILAKLRKISDIVLTLEFDKSVYAAVPEGNASIVITFPDAGGTITFWGDVKSVSDVDMETDAQPTFDVVIKVTNRNGSGVETAPVAG